MAKGFKHGTSGKKENPLNFAVVAYPSEVELNTAIPDDTTITTIGVVTTNPITGWHFRFEQPENMAEGEVWFSVGTASSAEFNALKQNEVMVYPFSAKQMVSGTLNDVVAKSYQGGAWVEWWNGELYKNGNQYENITGGWKCNSDIKWHSMSISGSIKYGEYLEVSVTGTACYNATTKNKIDMTEYSEIRYDMAEDSDTDNDGVMFVHGITSGNIVGQNGNTPAIARSNNGVINLSGISGEYYISICVASYGSKTIKVGNIRLVK